jgi:hypothetical protein
VKDAMARAKARETGERLSMSDRVPLLR